MAGRFLPSGPPEKPQYLTTEAQGPTEGEEIRKNLQGFTQELYKKRF